MATEPKPRSAISDLYWLITALILIGIVWYATGGPSRPSATSGPFLNKPQEKHSREAREQTEKISSGTSGKIASINPDESIYKYQAELSVSRAAQKNNPQLEYIEIEASSKNKNDLLISNWKVVGKTNLDIKLGDGVYLFFQNIINSKMPILLKPGEKAIISTGKSPIGASFKLNKCTGYFEQFQDFYPKLPKECPYPRDENLPNYVTNNDNCFNYIEKLPRCEVHVASIPTNLPSNCQDYIRQEINYKKCVDTHKAEADFYKPEWRIFLNRSEEMWKQQRETINLLDEYGKIIDQKSY